MTATIYVGNNPPIKNTIWNLPAIGLFDSDGILVSAPTIAAGDFKIVREDAAPVNITNTPMASGTAVFIILTAAEMNIDYGSVHGLDAAGDEWTSVVLLIPETVTATTVSDFDDTVDQVIVVTNNDKTGYALSAAGVDAILDDIIEGTLTFRQGLRIMFAVLFGKSSGGGTTNPKFRDIGDTKDRVDATTTAAGNRTAVSTDGT